MIIVAVVTATNDYTKNEQFRNLKAVADDIEMEVVRNGQSVLVATDDLVVGDVVKISAGDKVPADGFCFVGDFFCNQTQLTGESEDLHKSPSGDCFMPAGCPVTQGVGKMVVAAVGKNSIYGKIREMLQVEDTPTPLQEKLDTLAGQIGNVGMVAAGATFLATMVMWWVNQEAVSFWSRVLEAFIIAVTIVVVAVPEGLPLAVTISLAYSTKKMMNDNNLIRVLAACETMGNATTIASDKTGTLTMNKLAVEKAWLAGVRAEEEPHLQLNKKIQMTGRSLLVNGLCVNSTATLGSGESAPRGNATELALLQMVADGGFDVEATRAEVFDESRDRVFMFDSKRKKMSTLVLQPNGKGGTLFTKGAFERVLDSCISTMGPRGGTNKLTDAVRAELSDMLTEWSSQSYRVLALAHKSVSKGQLNDDVLDLEKDMILDGLIAARDQLRPGVKQSVQSCQQAGINVIMVTGDHPITAGAIAKECGIMHDGDFLISGREFADMTPAQLDQALPRLKVLARASPNDKLSLVTRLTGKGLPSNQKEWENEHPGASWDKQKDALLPGYEAEWKAARNGAVGEVVGVTGDGTNDAPALRAADVGLSMGIAGSEIAKEASDIVILDDQFASIVKAVLWGRCVFDNIRKFLQFQLTVNVVALALTFMSSVVGFEPPLNAVMMLWVNLIMDTMGALALGTEAPTPEMLDRQPLKRNAPLINRKMWRNILGQSIFQLAVLCAMLGYSDQLFSTVQGSAHHFTIVFNTFVFCQVFNELNARSIGDDMNVFKGLGSNVMFMAIIVFTVVTQVFIVQFGGDFTRTVPLSAEEWKLSVAVGFLALPVGALVRLVPVANDVKDEFARGAGAKPAVMVEEAAPLLDKKKE